MMKIFLNSKSLFLEPKKNYLIISDLHIIEFYQSDVIIIIIPLWWKRKNTQSYKSKLTSWNKFFFFFYEGFQHERNVERKEGFITPFW